MKLFAIVLLALGSYSAFAKVAPQNCSATETTTTLVDDKIVGEPAVESMEVGLNPENQNQVGAWRISGLHVAITFNDDMTEASDTTDYLDQMGDTRFLHRSVSVPLKIESDGSVKISHVLMLVEVGSNTENQYEITLSCKK